MKSACGKRTCRSSWASWSIWHRAGSPARFPCAARRRPVHDGERPAGRASHLSRRIVAAPARRGALRRGRRGAGGAARGRDAGFELSRPNALVREGLARSGARDSGAGRYGADGTAFADRIRARTSRAALAGRPAGGVIHADLFPDNVLFMDGQGLGPDRFLFRLQRCVCLRPGRPAQRLVLRDWTAPSTSPRERR